MSTENFTEALQLTHSFDPSVSSKERLEAEKYLMELKDRPEGLNLSFHIISNEQPVNELRCFWAFNTIIHHLPTLAQSVDDSQADELYRTLFSFIYRYLFAPGVAPADYLVNKHAQLMVVGLQVFYPPRWGSFFEDLFALQARNASHPPTADLGTTYFLRIFQYIDERVVSVRDRVDRGRDQRVRDMALKDAMRDTIIPRLVCTWYSLLAECRVRAPEMANLCLSVVQTYIEWIDVNLIMTPDWINLLYFLVTVPSLRISAVDCVLSLVEKKQLPGMKMASLQTLNLMDSLPRMAAMIVVPPTCEEDVVFMESVAKVIVAVAEQFLSLLDTCSSMWEQQQRDGTVGVAAAVSSVGADGVTVQDLPLVPSPELIASLSDALHAVMREFIRLFNVNVFEVKGVLLPFIHTYAKSAALLPAEGTELLFTVFQHTRIDRLSVDEERVWDDAIIDQRRSLHNLVRLMYRRHSDLVLAHMRALVRGVLNGGLGVEDNQILAQLASTSSEAVDALWRMSPEEYRSAEMVEAVLRYLYEIGEGVKLETVLRDPSEAITSMLIEVLLSDVVVQHTNACVHLAFFELMDRYYLLFVYHKDYVPVLLQRILLLPIGVTNRNDRVRARICYLFSHLLQVLKYSLTDYAQDMTTALHSIVSTTPALTPSDRRQLYESMGTLLAISLASYDEAGVTSADDARVVLVQQVMSSAHGNLQRVSGGPVTLQASDSVADAISYLSTLAKGLSGGSGSTAGTSDSTSSTSINNNGNGGRTQPSVLLVAQLFTSATDQVMESLSVWRAAPLVREAVSQYMQQMINTIPMEFLAPYVERYMAAAPQCMETVPELSRLLRLMYQYVNKIGAKGAPSVARMIPAVWDHMMSVGELASPSSPLVVMGVLSDRSRETADVYKQFFTFLFSIATWGCAEAFLMISSEYLSSILAQLLFAVSLPADMDLPKVALQTLTKLTTELKAPSSDASQQQQETAGNLRQWHAGLIHQACPAILQAVLRPQFDLNDAKCFLLLGEVGQWCKACASVLGEDALQAMFQQLAPFVGEDSAMNFCVAVRDQPRFNSALKIKFRVMLLQIRQNGHNGSVQ